MYCGRNHAVMLTANRGREDISVIPSLREGEQQRAALRRAETARFPLIFQGIHERKVFVSRAFHAFGHFERASSAAMCSIAISSPATKARRPVIRAPRSQAWAVTLSWCSPRMVTAQA